jgi:hypothetical protein
MHIERMQRAIALARELQHKPFYMNTWFEYESRPYDCETAACFAGWMARDKWMQNEGLELSKASSPVFEDEDEPWRALARFLDISVDDAHFVFDSYEYNEHPSAITPDIVADRLRVIVDVCLTDMG